MYKQFIKRMLDILLSGLALIILSPILLIVAVLVRIKLGSPVIFKQERPGYKGRIFKMFKFRTMLDPQTRDGRKLTDVKLPVIQKFALNKGMKMMSGTVVEDMLKENHLI